MTHTLHEPTLPHLSQLAGYESFGGRCDLVRMALSAGRLAEVEDELDSSERQPSWRTWAAKWWHTFILWEGE